MSEAVLREFLQAGYVFGWEIFPTEEGVGVGLTISPIIANMVLDGLQDYIYTHLDDYVKKNFRIGQRTKFWTSIGTNSQIVDTAMP